jgi:hypothetical protein
MSRSFLTSPAEIAIAVTPQFLNESGQGDRRSIAN